MSDTRHWDKIYADRPADQVGWYTPHLATSLNWIRDLGLAPNEAIIDVGGGASTLVDDLLQKGHKNITVLDISNQALRVTKQRLGDYSKLVTWLQGDVTELKLPTRHYRLWHDRAVFHFLTRPEERQRYKVSLLQSLALDGFLIIGTFAPDAPPQCSGLPVARYTPEMLSKFFAGALELKNHRYEAHITPSGVEQSYLYCLYQRTA